MKGTDVSTAIRLLRELLKEFRTDDKVTSFFDSTFRPWAFRVDNVLIRSFGNNAARLVSKWRQTIKGLPYPNSYVVIGYQEGPLKFMFESRLPDVEGTLEAIIEELETFGAPTDEGAPPPPRQRPKIFIAHGGESEALNKVANFLLQDLGMIPLVVERLPSEGRSVNENVEYYLGQADAGIILATADDLVDGKYQPRANVHIELGRFQERFPGQIIYLLEEGAAFPSNVSEKVWERFTDNNMESALAKIVREMRAFGLLGPSGEL